MMLVEYLYKRKEQKKVLNTRRAQYRAYLERFTVQRACKFPVPFTPGNYNLFADHIKAVLGSVKEAKEHLAKCVTKIHDDRIIHQQDKEYLAKQFLELIRELSPKRKSKGE
jgi:hypothetical protein